MFETYKEKRDQIQTSNVFTLRLFSQKMQVSFRGTPPTDILLFREFQRHLLRRDLRGDYPEKRITRGKTNMTHRWPADNFIKTKLNNDFLATKQ